MTRLGAVRVAPVLGAALVLAALAAFAALRASAAGAAPSAAQASRLVVKTAKNATLHKTILVNLRGRSLYSLSAERNGRFICTDSYCRSLWTPLVVPRGTKPTGVRLLATVRRPDGRTQVTYRGLPLYTFNEDSKPGDVMGNGFKDVGTWLVATVPTS